MTEPSSGSVIPPHNPLGFGCAYVAAGFDRRDSLRLLNAALDAGITHFDTAPMYGHGTSETVLGEAFKGRRDRITITTKAGIPRPGVTLKTRLRAVATPIRRLFPSLSRAAAAAVHGTSIQTDFTPATIRRSLEDSLRHLGTDYVDTLLLHEAGVQDMSAELFDVLAQLVNEGKVIKIGIGSPASAIEAIDLMYPFAFDVYQRTWSILRTDESIFPAKFNVYHRAVLDAIDTIKRRCLSDPAFARQLASEANIDAADSDELAKALLGASVNVNSDGLTLFASRRKARVEAYARDAATAVYRARGAALLRIHRASTSLKS